MSINKTVVKLSFNDSIRRFEVPVNSFDEFYASISKTLKLFSPFRLAYQDAEGDVVTFDSTQELQEALVYARVNDVLRVSVDVIESEQTQEKANLLAIPVQEEKKQKNVGVKNNNKKVVKKLAKLEKKALKKCLKSESKANKQADKLDRKQCKFVAKRDKLTHQACLQALRSEVRAKSAQLSASQAQVKQTRGQIKALGANAPAAEPLRAVLQEQLARHAEIKGQVQSKRAELQAARQAMQERRQVAKDNVVAKADNDMAVDDDDDFVKLNDSERLESARQRFEKHGLNVVLVTPQEMTSIKEQGKGAFQQFRRSQVANGKVLLMPAFVKRLLSLPTSAAVDKLVANKSKVLLAKGNGQVTGSVELAQRRAAIQAKQAELVRVRTELRELRCAFKESFQQQNPVVVAAAPAVVVGNTPM